MNHDLRKFPEEFTPLVVVLGDRREQRPKSSGDLLAYSVSTVDCLYLNKLRLPEDCLILSDKIFVIERDETLCDMFSQKHILTIGSPAVNLFSRRINDDSLYRLEISANLKAQMKKQEAIVNEHKLDRIALNIYKCIVEDGAEKPKDVVKLSRGKLVYNEHIESLFLKIHKQVKQTGLTNYRELLRNFEGSAILNPINLNRVDLKHPTQHGKFPQEFNDFGFVSLAKHPFTESDSFVVIYVAGRHGPATSHGVAMLANKENWEGRQFGGIFEVQIATNESFSKRLQYVEIRWDHDPYQTTELFKKQLPKDTDNTIKVFLSTPFKQGDRIRQKKAEWLTGLIENYYKDKKVQIRCLNPYELTYEGEWNYVNGILKHFPHSHFIVHNITGYSPGVIFEVGCSISLNKRLVLVWDTSLEPFAESNLPNLLKFTNIFQIDFLKMQQSKKKLWSIFDSIDWATRDATKQILIHDSKRDRLAYRYRPRDIEPDPQKVFVVVNEKWKEFKKVLLKRISEFGFSPVLPHDFTIEVELYRYIEGVETCAYSVVDITDDDLNGMLALGIARARERRAVEFRKYGSRDAKMFDGLKREWRDETLQDDIDAILPSLLVKS